MSQVPPEAGVFGIMDGDVCLYLGDSWNLRARLLELANLVESPEGLSITWERCPEPDCPGRRLALEQEFTHEPDSDAVKRLPGIHLRPEPIRRIA